MAGINEVQHDTMVQVKLGAALTSMRRAIEFRNFIYVSEASLTFISNDNRIIETPILLLNMA